MFGRIGIPEILIVLVILVLVFGVGRISKIAGEIGSGIRAFRDGLTGDDQEKTPGDNDKPDSTH